MHRLLIAAAMLAAVPALAQDKPTAPGRAPDATELEVANHWQVLELGNRNLAAALGRLVEDRRRLLQELEALKAVKPEGQK